MTRDVPIVDLVIGTRPNIVKAGPLFGALKNSGWCVPRLVFLAQHRQSAMTTEVLEDVGVADSEVLRIDLNSDGSGYRMGEMMGRFAEHLNARRPRLVVVFGDVDSTLAAAYSAKRLHLPVAHVEAGLRSGDCSMPEELNRRMVDSIADLLLTTTHGATENLLREGRDCLDIHHVGNIMMDALKTTLARSGRSVDGARHLKAFGLEEEAFAVATFHRPSNVDQRAHLQQVVGILRAAAEHLPVLFPVHPRSQAALERHDIKVGERILLVPPLRYSTFISLLSRARIAVTDSGGLQEETSILGVPCLTFRPNTERPETITLGTNRLARPEDARSEIDRVLARPMPGSSVIPLWDGNTASRIVTVLRDWFAGHGSR